MNNEPMAPKSFRPRHFSWMTKVLFILTIISLFAVSQPNNVIYRMMGGYGGVMGSISSGVTPPSPMMPAYDVAVYNEAMVQGGKGGGGIDYYPYPYYDQGVPVTDTREFLKVSYNASIQTRDVQGLTRRVETTVRGYGGRIDGQSSSREYGYVSFALPQAKYEAFRTELEGLVNRRFLTINIASQNLLPQKQSIEEQQKQADTNLADVKAARQRLVSTHTAAVKVLQAKIDALAETSSERAIYVQQLVSENASYTTQLQNADANIKYAQDWQKAVQTQDKTLLENVATVTGTVSLQRISLWDMAQVWLPGYSIPAVLAVLSFLSLLWDRRRFGTV